MIIALGGNHFLPKFQNTTHQQEVRFGEIKPMTRCLGSRMVEHMLTNPVKDLFDPVSLQAKVA